MSRVGNQEPEKRQSEEENKAKMNPKTTKAVEEADSDCLQRGRDGKEGREMGIKLWGCGEMGIELWGCGGLVIVKSGGEGWGFGERWDVGHEGSFVGSGENGRSGRGGSDGVILGGEKMRGIGFRRRGVKRGAIVIGRDAAAFFSDLNFGFLMMHYTKARKLEFLSHFVSSLNEAMGYEVILCVCLVVDLPFLSLSNTLLAMS